MPDTKNLLAALAYLREQAENIPLEDESEAVDIAAELYYLISQYSPTLHNPALSAALSAALSDMDAAEGRIQEYLDTPPGREAQDHLDSAIASIDDAIIALSQNKP